MELAMAFYGSRALMSALELDVFSTLADGPLPGAELAERAGIHSRVSADFLDALVALRLLERDDHGYRNGKLAEQFLVRDRPGYAGGFAEMGNASLFPLWSKLTDLLRTGQPQIPPGGNFFEGLYRNRDAAHKFMDAMDAFNEEIAAVFGSLIDWTGVSSLVDVGGARGDLASRLVRTQPGLTATTFDLPAVEELFTEHVADFGVTDRVRFHAGNFLTDELPAADVYVFGHILHGRDDGQRAELVARAFAGLAPGGVLFVYDRMIDDAREEKTLSLLGSLGMALVSPVGSEYTAADCRFWLTSAGFEIVATEPLAATDTVVVARKPATPGAR
jgi:O-methyltransferase domain/Dimerisation domain